MSDAWKSDRKPPESGTDLGVADEVVDGKSRIVAFGSGWSGVEIVIVREGERVYGYINECAHMAVPLNLLDDYGVETVRHRMVCDHHHASFRFTDGYCVEGPCEGESLTAVPLAVRAGRVVIA